MHHCPSGGCHQHVVQTFSGVASGSFAAPDHEYPSHEATNPFTDGGGIAPGLWDAVAILAARDIARGYDADAYGPNNQVLQAQAISSIARTGVLPSLSSRERGAGAG